MHTTIKFGPDSARLGERKSEDVYFHSIGEISLETSRRFPEFRITINPTELGFN